MIRDLRAWEYRSPTFVFHFRRAFFSLFVHTHIRTHACISVHTHMCVSIYREGERKHCMGLITRVGLHVCTCLYAKFNPVHLDKEIGKSFLLT